MFRNILDNAIRYSPPETVITAFAWEERINSATKIPLFLPFRMKGRAFLYATRNRIFRRFYQVDKRKEAASPAAPGWAWPSAATQWPASAEKSG
ncbi:MAG: hypothetical protein R2861_14375 [Desulfobacterales bacterium]